MVIPDPLSFVPLQQSTLSNRRVVAVARYSHEKGIDLLLQAWALVEQQNDDWQLDIYGEGDRQPYELLASRLGLKRCTLHGRTNDVERAYCESSLFVLSSRFEGFGMVIVEAMSCGLPVVAFDCPWGPRSIISNGEDGLLAGQGDVADLSRQLLSLMDDPARLTAMAAAAARNVQRFRIERIAEQWKLLFETVKKSK
jgi:glycosyltransferase involved in cell wall biosynthesis